MADYVGRSVVRLDALDKVTGRAVYAYDLEVPGMVYMKLVRSYIPHGRIKKINVTKAKSMSGVIDVITGDRFKDIKIGIYLADRNILAYDKVRFFGEPVAAVVALDPETAERAAELGEVEYEELTPVTNVEDALRGDILVHEDLDKYYAYPNYIFPVPHTNIANKFVLRKGDIEEGFKKADVVVENVFEWDMKSHAYMETMAVIAQWRHDGTIEIWTSAQSPFAVRYLFSKSLHIPESRIIVHVPYVGGGFGGKAGINLEPLVALVSREVGGLPVKLVLTREENFTSAPNGIGIKSTIKTGVTKDGKIVAEELHHLVESGAYADYAVNVGRTAGYTGAGPYDVPNVYSESLTIYTNKPYATAFRGFGVLEAIWAIERQMDLVAEKLGMDPVEFRLKNILRPGSTTSTGQPVTEDMGNLEKCIKIAADVIGWGKPPEKPRDPYKYRGRGIAIGMKGPSVPPNNAAQAFVRLNEDGTIDVSVGTTEYGQGTLTGLAQLVADEFGVPIENVRINFFKDTNTSAYTWQTVGSRGMYYDGNAVLRAVEDAKKQVASVAAKVLGVEPRDIVISDGKAYVRGNPSRYLTLGQVAMGYTLPDGRSIGGPIVGTGWYIDPKLTFLDQNGQGVPFAFITFSAHAVEVEVDVLTGEVKVLRYAAAFDVGKAINPSLILGQTVGGAVMGISLALYESIKFDDSGYMLNPNLIDYKVIRSNEVPEEIVGVVVETPQRDAPRGARGLGENVMIGVGPAIANAIKNAIGVDVRKYPITAERLWKEIKRQRPELLEL